MIRPASADDTVPAEIGDGRRSCETWCTTRVAKNDPEAGSARSRPRTPSGSTSSRSPSSRCPSTAPGPTPSYRLIHDELLLDGSSRLNLATFVTTWMEPEADRLMAEAFDKNMIDKDEYPQTAEIERRCVNMVAHLFNAPEDGDAVGASTIGSSEAVMLAGLAMKWTWRARREAAGKPTDKPNLILGSNVQVVWEKFCRYWDVEPRYIPVQEGRYVISPEEAVERIDENTIGVVAILGHHLHRRVRADRGDPRRGGGQQRRDRVRRARARRRRQRRVRGAVPAPGRRRGTSACPW